MDGHDHHHGAGHAHDTHAHDTQAHDAHPHDAHTHEEEGAHHGEWTSPLGLDEDFVRKFFDEWRAIEEEIASYNNVKKAMLCKTRALYGPYHTEALKRACSLALKDPAAVARDAVLNKVAGGYLKILRNYN